jgi:Na+/melibiose symporter-like transporter
MALFTYLIISSVLLRGFLSVYEIPNASLLPELTQNYNERTVLFSIRHLFNIIGGVGMGIAAFAIFLSPTEEFPVGQLNPEGYTNYSLVALLFIALSILASSLGTQSIARNFHKPEKRPSTPGSKFGGIWAVVANKALLSMLGTGMFAALAAGMIHALQVYMGTYYWELDNQDLAAIQGVSLVSILVAVVAATPLSAKFGKKETAVFMLLFVILGFSAPILLREFGLFPANGSDLLLPLILIERGTVTAASLTLIILASSMVADIVEDVEEKTGRRAEGLVQSVNTLVAKTVSGMGILAAGSVLAFIAFPDEATPGAISPDTLTSLGFTYIGVGIVFFSGSLLCLATYPLSRAGHEARLARLVRTTSETSVTTSD